MNIENFVNKYPKFMSVKIKNEQQLFAVLKNENNQYSDLKNLEFDDTFFQSLSFKLVVNAKSHNGVDLHGHITTDLMSIMYDLQQLVYKIYAIAKHGIDDIRKLTPYEKKKLTVLFKITEGSSIEEAFLGCILKFISSVQNMSKTQVVTVGVVFCVLVSGYFYRDIHIKNVERDEKLALINTVSTLSKQALDGYQEATFKNLNRKNIDVESAQINNGENMQQDDIERAVKHFDDEDIYTSRQEIGMFTIQTLFKKGGINKHATLIRNDEEIKALIPIDLYNDITIKTAIYKAYDENSTIKLKIQYMELDGHKKDASIVEVITND